MELGQDDTVILTNKSEGRPTSPHSSLAESSTQPSETLASPIPIVSPTLSSYSSSARSFNLRSSASPSSFSPSSDNPAALLDGPLTDLLPCVIGSPTSGSSSDDSIYRGWAGLAESFEPSLSSGRPTGRRVVSAPLGLYAISPSRSSPLTRSFGAGSTILDEDDEFIRPPTFRSRHPSSPASTIPRPIAFTPTAPSHHRRRRSSASHHQHPPFGSLVGSFENSLLSGRMSSLPSKPLPFLCSIGVLGSKEAPKKLQCPKHVHVEFGAVFYSSKEDRNSSPYVGTIDLERHYTNVYLSHSIDPHSSSTKRPKFPGYQVPVRGQIQLVLKNSNATAFKPFLVPYDLEGLNRDGRGGRTFLRQKSYMVESRNENGLGNEGDGKGKLRFAVHLTFCSPPTLEPSIKKKGTRKGEATKEVKYYLYQSIRVVFASQALDPTERVRVVLEGPAELLFGTSKGNEELKRRREEDYGDYRPPGEEWQEAKLRSKREMKAPGEARPRDDVYEITKERTREGREEEQEGDERMATSFTTFDTPLQQSTLFPTTSAPAYSTTPFIPVSSPSTSVSSPRPAPLPYAPSRLISHPLSMSTTFSSPTSPSFAPLFPAPPLTFERVPSPIAQDLARLPSRDRKQSVLSLSRPNSPALFARSSESTVTDSNAHDTSRDEDGRSRKRTTASREREMCGR